MQAPAYTLASTGRAAHVERRRIMPITAALAPFRGFAVHKPHEKFEVCSQSWYGLPAAAGEPASTGSGYERQDADVTPTDSPPLPG